MISYIFVFMIVVSVCCSVFLDTTSAVSDALMNGAYSAVELLISMSGMMCLWSGVMKVAKDSGLTEKLSNLLSPLLKKLFPDISKDSMAFKSICMNVSANLLGLSNAATPLGINAMKELKKLSITDEATDSMITFVVMNTASIQLLPTTLAVMRDMYGSKSPFDIIFCVWVTSALALFCGLLCVKILCRTRRKRWSL